MERKDLGQGAWWAYERQWLDASEADRLLPLLLAEFAWEQRQIVAKGKPVMQPRLMAWAGDMPYRYSNQVLEPRPMSPAIAALRDRLAQELDAPFNHVVANLYRDGRDRVGFHADDEPELGYEPLIASVSLGAKRRFVMRYKYKQSRKRGRDLLHGSLLVMGGSCQHRWYHGVPGDSAVTEPRINLTFRVLRGPPGWRAPREEDPRQWRRDG